MVGVGGIGALVKARVPGELHVYDGGGPGNALRAAPLSEWAPNCARWLASLLEKAPAPAKPEPPPKKELEP